MRVPLPLLRCVGVFALGLVAVGCPQPAGPPPSVSDAGRVGPGPLLVDVVVRDNNVEVWVRDRERVCTCTNGDFPAAGACATRSEITSCSCEPDADGDTEEPAACLETMRLLDGETVIDELQEGEWTFDRGKSRLAHDDGRAIDSLAAPRLEIIGCGRRDVVDLPRSPPSRPVFERFTAREGVGFMSWDSESPGDASLFCSFTAFGGECCRDAWQTAGEVALPPNEEQVLNLFFQQLVGGQPQEKTVGDVRVWHAGGFNTPAPWAPQPLEDGRYSLGVAVGLPQLYLTVPSLGLDSEELFVVEMSAVLDVEDPLATLEFAAVGQPGIALRYRVDSAGSPIELHVDGQVYTSLVAYARPEGELTLGDDEARIVVVTLDDAQVRNTADDTQGAQVTFSTSLYLPPIADPLP